MTNTIATRARAVVTGDRAARSRQELREALASSAPSLLAPILQQMAVKTKAFGRAIGLTPYTWEEHR
jgi:hypothetical protein